MSSFSAITISTCSTKAATSGSTSISARISRTSTAEPGTNFAVWAPDAETVYVMGDFNGWNNSARIRCDRGDSGIWELFRPERRQGDSYKYHVVSRYHGYPAFDKADPFAFHAETPPQTASMVWDLDYEWNDRNGCRAAGNANTSDAPMSIYEVHLGSWRRVPEDNNRSLSYREIAPHAGGLRSSSWALRMSSSCRLTEHPFYGSWGYQTTGYFAPTSRYGTPQDLMYLIDYLHQRGIGVILDWVPSHFPTDEWALGLLSTARICTNTPDPEKGIHKDWDSLYLQLRPSRSSQLSAEQRHVLAGRAITSTDCAWTPSLRCSIWTTRERKASGFPTSSAAAKISKPSIPPAAQHGGLQAPSRRADHRRRVHVLADGSRPTYVGGLGFGLKWDMGWMHDTLKYMSLIPSIGSITTTS